MPKIREKVGFDHGVWVDAVGWSGGLALFWKNDVALSIRSMGQRYIDFEVKCDSGEYSRGTGLYGWSKAGQKWKTWELIRGLGGSPSMPWLLAGDFNEVLFKAEKNRGNACDFSSISDFKNALEESRLKDLGCSRHLFTWSN